jgi:hypothetical protein
MCDGAEWRRAAGFCGHKRKFCLCRRLEMLSIWVAGIFRRIPLYALCVLDSVGNYDVWYFYIVNRVFLNVCRWQPPARRGATRTECTTLWHFRNCSIWLILFRPPVLMPRFVIDFVFRKGLHWCLWLRHCATSCKFAGSIPDGVIGISHWHDPSGRTMALGLTNPQTGMITTGIYWGVKAAGV